jgi:hypothetical protein
MTGSRSALAQDLPRRYQRRLELRLRRILCELVCDDGILNSVLGVSIGFSVVCEIGMRGAIRSRREHLPGDTPMMFDASAAAEYIAALMYTVAAIFFVLSVACGLRVRN